MTSKQIDKVVKNRVNKIVQLKESNPDKPLRADLLEALTDYYLDLYPVDAIQICLMIKDDLRAKGINL